MTDAINAMKTKRDEAITACENLANQRQRQAIFANELRDKHIAAEAVRDSLNEIIKTTELTPPATETESQDATAP